jgi:hypothetical protein
MRTLIAVLTGVAVGVAAAVAAGARADLQELSQRHEEMPDVTTNPEAADA